MTMSSTGTVTVTRLCITRSTNYWYGCRGTSVAVVILWCFVNSIDSDFRRAHRQSVLATGADACMRQPLRLEGEEMRVVDSLHDFRFTSDERRGTHDAVPKT